MAMTPDLQSEALRDRVGSTSSSVDLDGTLAVGSLLLGYW